MKPLRAFSMIRQEPSYRAEAFRAGLARIGYDVHQANPHNIALRPGEVLVIWNRYDLLHTVATRVEAQGGIVLVAENGYLGVDRNDRRIYALARHAHNGRGQWASGGPERFEQLGIALEDWTTRGEHILVAPNRSFGMPGGIMPADWADRLAADLKTKTKRPVRVRMHPGNLRSPRPLEDDLRGAHAVVIWSSSVGVEALVRGIPVISAAPWWILKDIAAPWPCDLETLPRPDRRPAFERLAWAQWTVEEIADGRAFRHLLHPTGEAQVAARA